MTVHTSSPFQPDTILPAQYASTVVRDDGMLPERRLMLAILGDAVQCIQRYALARNSHGRVAFQEAAAWFESTESEWLFSFESICRTLGLASDQIRSALPKGQHPRTSAVSIIPQIIPLTRK